MAHVNQNRAARIDTKLIIIQTKVSPNNCQFKGILIF